MKTDKFIEEKINKQIEHDIIEAIFHCTFELVSNSCSRPKIKDVKYAIEKYFEENQSNLHTNISKISKDIDTYYSKQVVEDYEFKRKLWSDVVVKCSGIDPLNAIEHANKVLEEFNRMFD